MLTICPDCKKPFEYHFIHEEKYPPMIVCPENKKNVELRKKYDQENK